MRDAVRNKGKVEKARTRTQDPSTNHPPSVGRGLQPPKRRGMAHAPLVLRIALEHGATGTAAAGIALRACAALPAAWGAAVAASAQEWLSQPQLSHVEAACAWDEARAASGEQASAARTLSAIGHSRVTLSL